MSVDHFTWPQGLVFVVTIGCNSTELAVGGPSLTVLLGENFKTSLRSVLARDAAVMHSMLVLCLV